MSSILIEPNEHEELKTITNSIIYNDILSSTEQTVQWYSNNTSGDSIYKENTHFYKDIQSTYKETTTLDKLLTKHFSNSIPNNLFLKLDTQGSEPDIIKGAIETLKQTDLIYIEVPIFGKYNETPYEMKDYIDILHENDFIIFDIINPIASFYTRYTMQADMLFINKKTNLYQLLIEDFKSEFL